MKTAIRALYRPFDAVVIAVTRLSPSFVRITFGGQDLRDFQPEGFDQRLKVIVPNADGDLPDFADSAEGWYAAWRNLPEQSRPPMRTYTVRAWRRMPGDPDGPGPLEQPGPLEVDIDFVVHGEFHEKTSSDAAGPVSRWLLSVGTGDRVLLVGPDAVSGGPWCSTAWSPPPEITRYLLAGDETAAPAIAAILEALPEGCQARAFIEVPLPGDILPVALPHGVELTWLPRVHRQRGVRLREAVGTAVSEFGGVYAWIAGEAGVVTAMRRHLVQGAGLDRTSVAFMGYWRSGSAES